ncbi:MAG: hypothetical protein AAF907_11485 [Planctomycetota bacterium]
MTAPPSPPFRLGADSSGLTSHDGTVATFAPPLPPVPLRPAGAASAARRPPVSPERSAARLAELFGEEEDRPAAARFREEPRPEPAPADRRANPPAVAVRLRERQEQDDRLPEPLWVGVSRGAAAVLSVGATLGAVAVLKPEGQFFERLASPAWLEHFAPLPDAALGPTLAFCGTALGLFALKPALPTPARWGAGLAALALGGAAVKAAVADGWANGFGPTLAWQIAVCCLFTLFGTCWNAGTPAVRRGWWTPAVGLLACGLTFPLADGALGEPTDDGRSPQMAAKAVASWWTDALRFPPGESDR